MLDILAACDRIAEYVNDATSSEEIVFDAIRIRLLEIGEAVKDIDPRFLSREPTIPWREIARMRDLIVHRYFDTAHDLVFSTARDDVPALRAAVERMAEPGPEQKETR